MTRWILLMAALGTGCVVHDRMPLETQVRTFPEGALVEFNGRSVGRAPAAVVLPQDTNGRLVERTVIRAVPNTAQSTLIAQTRVFEPGNLTERVPDYVMIDMTLPATNSAASALVPPSEKIEKPRAVRPKAIDRGKPTQPVGIDRWTPGIY